jgi:hypothetical protein
MLVEFTLYANNNLINVFKFIIIVFKAGIAIHFPMFGNWSPNYVISTIQWWGSYGVTAKSLLSNNIITPWNCLWVITL